MSDEPARFEIEERAGGRVDGWSPGFERRRLRSLRKGEIVPDRELDLHGMRRDEARLAVRELLSEAVKAGVRCVLVIHGRGTRSEAGPVLRDALRAWLAEPPHGASVLAFAASDKHAGGATYVLLRRVRPD